MRNCNIFIIFHAWYQNTSVLYTAWRGIFHRDLAEDSFCDVNTFEPEMIISIVSIQSVQRRTSRVAAYGGGCRNFGSGGVHFVIKWAWVSQKGGVGASLVPRPV